MYSTALVRLKTLLDIAACSTGASLFATLSHELTLPYAFFVCHGTILALFSSWTITRPDLLQSSGCCRMNVTAAIRCKAICSDGDSGGAGLGFGAAYASITHALTLKTAKLA